MATHDVDDCPDADWVLVSGHQACDCHKRAFAPSTVSAVSHPSKPVSSRGGTLCAGRRAGAHAASSPDGARAPRPRRLGAHHGPPP